MEERFSYMMLFCALLLVRNAAATLEESFTMVPLAGKAKRLAAGLAGRPRSDPACTKAQTPAAEMASTTTIVASRWLRSLLPRPERAQACTAAQR